MVTTTCLAATLTASTSSLSASPSSLPVDVSVGAEFALPAAHRVLRSRADVARLLVDVVGGNAAVASIGAPLQVCV
jgi:hypothetical protein